MSDDQSFPDPIPGIFPHGSICTFAGATGVGKTALFAGWVKSWQEGGTICGVRVPQLAEIGIIAGDRRWRSHSSWFETAGCHEVKHYSLRDDASFNWLNLRNISQTRTAFNKILDTLDLAPGSLLGLDPMSLFLPGRMNDYKDMAIGLGVLDQLLYPRQLSCLGIFHQSKQIADKNQQYLRPQDRILGSAAQIGFSDTAMYLLSPQDLQTEYYGFGWVPHHAPPETFKFKRDAYGLFLPFDDEATGEYAAILSRVYALVPEPPGDTTRRLLAMAERDLEMPERTFKRHLARLCDEGRIEQPTRGRWQRRKPS